MDPFRRVRGGVASFLDVHERLFLGRPFADVAALLGHREPPSDLASETATGPGGGPGTGVTSGARAPGDDRTGGGGPSGDEDLRGGDLPPSSDEAVLAALDFVPTDAGPAGDRTPSDPALARLLPDMSTDETLAGKLRELTEGPLRVEKIARLLAVVDELEDPTGPRGTFLVRDGHEADVLRAVNDVRLVLATRLGVGEAISDDELHERAQAAGRGGSDGPDAVLDAMAILYTSLTWWQESLINALHTRRRPN
ncbi:MAG: DUF2017 family protein [Actinomycetaceae bacterium]